MTLNVIDILSLFKLLIIKVEKEQTAVCLTSVEQETLQRLIATSTQF